MANSAVVGLLRALLVADSAEFDKAMKRAGDSAKAWSKDLQKIGRDATAVGQTLTAGITAPLLGLAAGASKLAIDFESSFAGVRKTVDGSEADFAKLSDQFRDLAKTIPVNVNQINALGESAGALGIPREQIVKFVEVMAGLGTATNLTADEAATSIARIQNIFGAAGKDTDRFASTLVALGNAGASTEKEIVDMAARISGAGHTVGMSQAQVLAFSSTLASVGINAEAGGSAMSKMLLKMNDAVSKGGASLKGFAKVAGTSAADFRQAFETDAAGAVTTFVEGLQRIKEHGGNLSATLEPLIGKNIILKDTMLRLAGAGELMERDLKNANTAWQENTALQNETAKRYETTAAQLTILWNRIKDVGITIGQALLPVVKSMVDAFAAAVPYIEGLVKWFTDLPTGIQTTVVAIAGIAAAAGPALMAFGAMSSGLGTLVGAFKQGGIAARGFAVALAFIEANPVVFAITAIATALGVLGVAIYASATAETESEKALRTHTKAFNDQLASMDKAITTYETLKGKQNLTTQESKDLDSATRALAEGSGQTVDAFEKESEKALALAKSLRDVNKEIKNAAIEKARAAKSAAADAILQTAAERQKVGAGKGTVFIPGSAETGPGGDVPMSAAESADALRKLDAELVTLRGNLATASAEYDALTGRTDDNAAAMRRWAASFGIHTAAVKAHSTATTDDAEATKEQAAAAKKAAREAAAADRERSDALYELHSSLADLTVAQYMQIKAELAAGQSEEQIAKAYGYTRRQINLVQDAVKDQGDGAKDWAETWKQIMAAQVAQADKTTKAMVEMMLRTAGLEQQAADLRAERTMSAFDFQLRQINQWADNEIAALDKSIAGWEALEAAIEKVRLEKTIALVDADVANAPAPPPPPTLPPTWGDKVVKTVAGIFENDIPNAIDRAFAGDSWASIGQDLAKNVVSMFANLIPVVGPIIGAIGRGLIDKAFAHKGRDAVVAFADSMGGFDELHKKLEALGADGQRMWVQLTQGTGAKDEKAAQRIIDQITGAFKNEEQAAADAAARTQTLKDKIGELGTKLADFGGKAPAALQPMIDTLLASSGLTAEMRKSLEDMAGAPSWQTMQEHAEKLGIDLAALGPQFQSAKLTDIALGYARDLQTFSDAGADMQGVIVGMSDELSTLYQDAKKNGIALPATLEPYMKALTEQGLLLDANGEKVKNLDEVAFKDIEDKSLTAVVDVLKEIKDLLEKQLPAAADQGAADIKKNFEKNKIKIPVEYDYTTTGGPPTAGPPAPAPQIGLQGGTHGQYIDWGAGTDVTLHGKERVVPEGEAVAGGGAPIHITVVSQLDGREVARNQVRYIPNELRAAGV